MLWKVTDLPIESLKSKYSNEKVILTGHGKGPGKALALALIEKGCDALGLSRARSGDLNCGYRGAKCFYLQRLGKT